MSATGTAAAGTAAAALHRTLAERDAAGILPTYRRAPVQFVSGHGAWLVDDAGHEHLDFLSGLSVTSLGHAHPAVTAAVAEQVQRLVHVSNLFLTEPQVALAERLQQTLRWPDGKAFFCNSGAEANEAAVKLTRRHGKRQHPDKVEVVAFLGGFHGRLTSALKLTGNPAKHAPFEPLGDWVVHVPHDDPEALRAAVTERTCAVWAEVVQGEGGVRPVPSEVLQAARAACDEVGALLVVDEVQTGVGRLGAWWGFQTTVVEPDVVCAAKALANGLPIGAIVARGEAATAFEPGDHASTFGGGPVVAAAANAVLDTVAREGLVRRAAATGARLAQALGGLAAAHPVVAGARGRGLLQALVLDAPVASELVALAREERLVVNDVAADAVRLAPPLIVEDTEVDEAIRRLDRALARLEGS